MSIVKFFTDLNCVRKDHDLFTFRFLVARAKLGLKKLLITQHFKKTKKYPGEHFDAFLLAVYSLAQTPFPLHAHLSLGVYKVRLTPSKRRMHAALFFSKIATMKLIETLREAFLGICGPTSKKWSQFVVSIIFEQKNQ